MLFLCQITLAEQETPTKFHRLEQIIPSKTLLPIKDKRMGWTWLWYNSDSFAIFKSKLLKFIQPCPNIVFNGHNPKENEGNHTSLSWFESTLLTKI